MLCDFPRFASKRMSHLPVDCNGNRVKTDVLTDGYIRGEIENKLKLSIPSEIKHLCFVFWFINICDEWDHTLYTKKSIIIDEQTVTTIQRGYCSIMGCHRVSSGRYEWKLKHFSKIGACVGIIKDLDIPKERISRTLNEVRYDTDEYGAFWEPKIAEFFAKRTTDFMSEFRDKIKNNDVIIGVKIDFDSEGLYFSVDGSEYSKAPYTLEKDQSYRLVVSFWREKGAQIQLL